MSYAIGRLAAPSSRIVGRAICMFDADADAVTFHVENFAHDLMNHRVNSRTDIGHADMDDDATVRFDGDRRTGTARARRTLVDSYAASDVFSLRLFPTRRV